MPDAMPGLTPDPQQNSTPAPPAWSQHVITDAPAAGNGPPPPPDMEAAPKPVKPDGGILGNAVISSLQQVSKPPDMEAAPADMDSANAAGTTPPSSWWDTAKKIMTFNPILTPLHMSAGATADAANTAVQNREQANQVAAAHGLQSPYSDITTLGLRMGAGVADTVASATTPQAAAMAAASATPVGAAVVGGGLLSHGLYRVGKGVYNMIQDWGNLAWENPELWGEILSGQAEVLGGVTGVTDGMRGIAQSYKNSVAHTPDVQYEQIQNAIPSTKSAPYTKATWDAAKLYLQAEHATGVAPIEGEDAVRNFVESSTTAIGKIENKISKVIEANPDVPVLFKDASGGYSPIDPMGDASTALQGSVRKDFLDAGLAELKNYPLDPVEDGPLTLQKADDIRKQLNADNEATLSKLQAKGKFAVDRAMTTDPAFAARQAAAESLRSGIYETLEQLGVKDAAAMRLDEGALIKMRKAAQNQVENAEKPVTTNKKPSTARKVAQKLAVGGGAALGFEVGAQVGHPLLGSTVGAEVGSQAAKAIAPEKLTRNEWLERAFEPITATPAPAPIQGVGIPGVVASQIPPLPAGYVHVRNSDGSEHFVPEAQMELARQTDPGLQILNPTPAAPQQ